MKTVLVTGATGFIGRWTIPMLKSQGFSVHAISSKPINNFNDTATWYTCDLRDQKAVDSVVKEISPSHLLHLAWYTKPSDYWTSPENIQWINASFNLLRSFQNVGGTRVVTGGTCAEYDWQYGYCSEFLTPSKPSSIYGITKGTLFQIQKKVTESDGISSAWGRIFFLYGPHEYPERYIPSIIRSILSNRPYICRNGNLIRDYLFVQDVASAFISILNSTVEGPINIASGIPISLKDISMKIFLKMTNNLNNLQFGNIKPDEKEYPIILANTNRLNNELGWKPQTDIDKGLDITIEWWKKQVFSDGRIVQDNSS